MSEAERAETLERRLRRERRARREAEAIAERVTTELYETVLQLKASKLVLDETTDFVSISEPDGTATYLNRSLYELLGRDRRLGSKVNVFDLLTPQSRVRYTDEATPALLASGLWRGEFAWVHPDGGELAVSQVLIAHRDPEGRINRISSISRDVTEQRVLQEQLAFQALHDHLTGSANRRLFFDRLDLAQARASRSGTSLAIFFLDLDRFKAVNDELGHEAGDQVLMSVAERLRANLRAADTLARFGGDEFAVLCEDLVDVAEACQVAERLVAAVGQPIAVGDVEVDVGVSVGVVITNELQDGDTLVQRADAAMYQAKAEGRGRYHVSTE